MGWEQALKSVVGKGSMQKTSLVCSLLMAFGLTASMVGCDQPKKEAATPPKAKMGSGAGSTTGGGASVPPAKGKSETPKAPEKAGESPKADAPK